MKTLLAIVGIGVILAIVVVAVAGALRVNDTEDQVNITIDKNELKQKADQAVEEARDLRGTVVEKTREILSPSASGDNSPPSDATKDPG